MKFVILTGMSGAGKSTAIKMMEDIGYYCVDNLPIALLEKFVELSSLQENAELQKVAVGIDIRNGQALEEIRDVLARIKKKKVHYEILFLDAEDIFHILGISKTNIYYMLRADDFPTITIGKRRLVRKEKLFAWLEAHEKQEARK